MEKNLLKGVDKSDFLLYKSPDGEIKVEVFLWNETIWLTQKRMGELFGVKVPAISKHLNNIYAERELVRLSTVSILETVREEGDRKVKRNVEYYNLDAIIAVGYRVNSSKATQFRIWATKVLREYIIKGFVLDDERLKNGRYFGKDYFRELLERVRSIRTSERRIYQKITDIFAECSIDYDKSSEITKGFYAMVQNKFHFAITGMTAAEIVYKSADRKKRNMGLTTWQHSPDGRILKSDVKIAKNYLDENEIKQLERTVSGYFDYIERLIEKRTLMRMEDLADSVNRFLEFNEYKILDDKGKVSHRQAEQKAVEEYDEFNKTQEIESDFDRLVKELMDK
ncbi:MAG: virulence RhuM family protein [Candidatus Electryonea clarkiae]|nr:virulence RhuM family protein [Candidatus Stygibacter australis]MDP8286196.1 virulence RhuM family protein [Candidatus Electryonea clarkiae]